MAVYTQLEAGASSLVHMRTDKGQQKRRGKPRHDPYSQVIQMEPRRAFGDFHYDSQIHGQADWCQFGMSVYGERQGIRYMRLEEYCTLQIVLPITSQSSQDAPSRRASG